jgi:hypothetical protein
MRSRSFSKLTPEQASAVFEALRIVVHDSEALALDSLIDRNKLLARLASALRQLTVRT